MKSQDNTVRLQKIIAEAGLASRRQAESWISDGYVTVNGKTASLGDKADPSDDSIKIRGKLIQNQAKEKIPSLTLMMNKPKGLLCSNSDPHDTNTVFAALPKQYQNIKLFCAGRLDKPSEGLIILTNDGELANKITHPSHHVIKKYLVTLSKPLDPKLIPKLVKGLTIDGEFLHAKKIVPLKDDNLYEVHLESGRKREIRRLFHAFKYFVNRLKRIQIGGLVLKNVPVGGVKALTKKDLSLLFKQ